MIWRSKLFLVMCAVVVLAMGLMYWVSAVLIQGEFFRIEDRQVQQNEARALDAQNNEIDQLEVKAIDWSNWDDNYQFVTDHNQAFIKSNLADGSLADLGINFMLFYNAKDQLVEGKGIDAEGNDMPVPQALLDEFKPNSPLFATSTSSVDKGLVSLPDAPVMLVTLPILKSDGTGPLHGTLVFGASLDSGRVKGLADLTHLDLAYYGLTGAKLPADVASARPGLSTGTTKIVRLDSDNIAGYQLINDIYNKPFLVLKVLQNRAAYNEAIHGFYLYLIIISAVLLVLVLVTAYFARQLVLRDRTIQLKNQFFSIASDELRTPLFDIRGKSMQLSDQYGGKTDERFEELTHEISDSSVRLIRLVSNFLDAVRMERANMSLSTEEFSMKEAAVSVRDELAGLAGQRHLEIVVQVPDSLPRVRADKERVQQVLYNLVGSAVAKTTQGTVTVSAAADGQRMRVFVSDTGPGLKPAEFRTLARQLASTRPGVGVGGSNLNVFISKSLVAFMGGEMRLEQPSSGSGTSISFTLPIVAGGATSAQSPPQSVQPTPKPDAAPQPDHTAPPSEPAIKPTPPTPPPST